MYIFLKIFVIEKLIHTNDKNNSLLYSQKQQKNKQKMGTLTVASY